MSRPEIAAGPEIAAREARPRRVLAGAASALAIAAALGAMTLAAGEAQAQYQPGYGNPLAGGPVPYSALQGGGAATSQYYGQAYANQPYGYQQQQPYAPYGAGAPGTGSIVYDRSVLGGGYQPPFYAGAAGQGGYQPGYQAQGVVPYGAPPVVQGPPGVYGQVGGLYVPGPQAPVSQLYIQPGVAAPGNAQAQIGAATGMLPPAPPTAPTSAPQQAAAQTAPALPPAPAEVAPPPAPSTTGTSPTVPIIVEDRQIAEPPAPPVPPAPPPATTPPPIVDAAEDTPTEIVPPPPPADPPTVATADPTPPPAPPPVQVDTPPAPPPTPATRDELASTETAPPPPPVTDPPPQVADPPPPAAVPAPAVDVGGVALSISFGGGASELPAASEAELRGIAQQMLADDSLRLTIRAYAEGTAEEPSPPRRLSLSRALAVRSFLIEQGIRGPRMDVRALGHRTDPPRDRVDLVLASQ